jgi:predicted amidophosphoribosyltransferase
VLFTPTCPLCGHRGAAPCVGCRSTLRRVGPVAAPVGIDTCAALLRHDGAGRALVIACKYRNRRDALPWLAAEMAALVATPPDLVTWAPTTAARRGARGYDQAELLARRVARSLGRPCRGLLARLPGDAQTGRPAADRRRGVAFVARPVPSSRILLVDDVLTTGSTLSAAAAALRRQGAGVVDAVVAAHRA